MIITCLAMCALGHCLNVASQAAGVLEQAFAPKDACIMELATVQNGTMRPEKTVAALSVPPFDMESEVAKLVLEAPPALPRTTRLSFSTVRQLSASPFPNYREVMANVLKAGGKLAEPHDLCSLCLQHALRGGLTTVILRQWVLPINLVMTPVPNSRGVPSTLRLVNAGRTEICSLPADRCMGGEEIVVFRI